MNKIKLYKLIKYVLDDLHREDYQPLEVVLCDPRTIRGKLQEALEELEVETNQTDFKSSEVKMLKALKLAEGIMEYCGGDSWERCCTELDRQEFEQLYKEIKGVNQSD